MEGREGRRRHNNKDNNYKSKNTMKKYAFLCGILLSAMCMQAQNAVVYVAQGGEGDGSSWTSPMGDIQKAINLAGSDRDNVKNVWIKAGTYNIEKRIDLKDSVSVYGGFAGTETLLTDRAMKQGGEAWEFVNQTIINGGDKVACMAATKPMTVPIAVEGVVLEHGAALKANNDNGGGIRLNTNVTLRNSIVRNCYSDNAGGGVQIYPAGDMQNCLIANNRQETGGNGGGGCCSNNSTNGEYITIDGCTFVGNTSAIRGGGINTQGAMGTTINACTFYNNTAVDATGAYKPGAAIYDNGQNMSHITNCVIYNNSGTNAVYLKANEFLNNTVIKNVGGVYMASAVKTGEISNNIIWACETATASATSFSGTAVSGLKVQYNYTYNPISSENGYVLSDNADVVNTNKQFYSNQNNGDYDLPEDADPGDKITMGPKFRRLASFVGAVPSGLGADSITFALELDSVDLQLNSTSPLINAGKELTNVITDRNGDNRPQGGKTDVGAYELSYYVVKIGAYNKEEGAIYDENGTTIDGESELNMLYGGELYLYFLNAEGVPAAKVTATKSTDGGLTFDGETIDVTNQMDENGALRMKVYEPMLLTVAEWAQKTAIDNTTSATLRYTQTQDGICLAGLESGKTVEVYDLNGQLVVRQQATASTMNIALQAGMYVVRQDAARCKAVVR